MMIDLQDVRLVLPSQAGPVEILRGLDLQAEQGETIGVVGPSGSGKTTLLMVIGGLEAATSGRVTVAGVELTDLDEDALTRFRRDHIGVVFQNFHLMPMMTAWENVAAPLEFKGISDASGVARRYLSQVGLERRLRHYPGQLSGGEQQRVAIARALAAGGRILLADEPTGNLDQENGQAIMELLFSLAAERGATVLLVTHDPRIAARCRRVVQIRDGRAVADG